jgi:hypothetical protein
MNWNTPLHIPVADRQYLRERALREMPARRDATD